MSFRMRDETAGRDLLYIDNSGDLGLGSLPNGGQQLAVNGVSVFGTSAFAPGMLQAGTQISQTGVVAVPANGTTSVSINTGVAPSVTAGLYPSAVSSTSVTLRNPDTSTFVTTAYSVW